MQHFRYITITGLLLFALSACTNDHREPVTPKLYACDSTVSFSAQIKPLLDAKCIRCHDNTFSEGELMTYEGAKAKVNNGQMERVVVKQNRMPPIDGLPESERKLIYCWIQQGAPNN